MSALTGNPDADALFGVLEPELRRLCNQAPLFGKISLSAAIHDGDAGQISLGVEISRKIAPRTMREGGTL